MKIFRLVPRVTSRSSLIPTPMYTLILVRHEMLSSFHLPLACAWIILLFALPGNEWWARASSQVKINNLRSWGVRSFWWLVSRYWVPFPVSSLHIKFCESNISQLHFLLLWAARIQICHGSVVFVSLAECLCQLYWECSLFTHNKNSPTHWDSVPLH